MRVLRALIVPAVCLGQLATAQSSLPIFTDALGQGWQNWSWATVNLNNTSPVRTGTRSLAVTMGGWQALSVNRTALDTVIYKSLRFWVHGGATGGQRFTLRPTINGGAAGNQVTIPAAVANTWTQHEVSLATLGVTNIRDLSGFWFQSAVGSSQPTVYFDDIELVPVDRPATTTLTVRVSDVLQPVDDRMFGVNTAVWDASLNSASTISLMRAMGSRLLRFPGGSMSDDYNWKTGRTGSNTWSWATDFDDFVNVMVQTGQQATITVNYGSGTVQDAADWVREANVVRRLGIKYWDVGNENYGTWEVDNNNRPHDPVTYANRFQQFMTAMKAVDPTIKVGAPVSTGEDAFATYTDQTVVNPRTGKSHNGWTPVLLTRFRTLGIRPDYVVIHRYEFWGPEENDDILLQRAKTWPEEIRAMRQQLTDYLGPAGDLVEIQTNENNSSSGAQGKQSVSVVNAMYYLDSLGHLLTTEARMFAWWDWRNGRDDSGNNASHLYGWRMYGDLGMGLNATDQYPTYYAAKLIQNFARAGDETVSASSNNPFLTTFGARGRDGSLRVLVVSKHPRDSQTATLNLPGYTPASSHWIHRYGIAQDENARLGSGNVDVTRTAGVNASSGMTITVAPYTAAVYQFTAQRKVGGTLTLGDWEGPQPTEARFEFRNPSTGAVVWSVVAPISTSRTFTLNGPPVAGPYRLSIRYRQWLRRTVPVDLTNGSVIGVSMNLVNGDIDGDNAVTVFDYDLLSAAFDTAPGESGFLEAADLDGDGTVTVFDYDVLSRNFDQVGDD